jgi:penicillin-binding protein 2
LGVFFLAACASLQPLPTLTPAPPTPTPNTPDPEGTAQAFLDAWARNDYAGMYSLLSPLSQDAVSQADFQSRYEAVMQAATATSVETQIYSALKSGANARIAYEASLHTALFGEIVRKAEMPLVFTQDRWAVSWTDALILPELANGGTLNRQISFPARGNIYDRTGLGLAVQGEAVAIGVQPGQITDEPTLLTTLSGLLGLAPAAIQAKYANVPPDWYVPIGAASAADVQANLGALSSLAGVKLSPYTTRFYPLGGVAPQVVGYMSSIQPEELEAYRAKGYTGDERVGRAGLELWGEPYLAGTLGGTLTVVTPNGQATLVAEAQRQPAQALYTTLDRKLQIAAQQALGDFRGSIVVLNPFTGEVLAMASNPAFDPNLFDPTNRDSEALEAVLDDPATPLLNRATQSAYPPGSVFKIAVMGAGLMSGLYTRDTIINCGNTWSGLGPNILKYNWTFGTNIKPPGRINFVQALATSCNPYFYTVAFDLDGFDPAYLPKVARQFGLGEFTQIGQAPETQGLMPDPAWKQATYNDAWRPGDSVNMGIGQGYILVTPLQIAQLIAAVRNGGTLYRPQLIERIAPPGGEPTYTLTPIVNGALPVTADQLAAIKEGLHAVTSEPGGTARHRFLGLSIPVAGKTGTAQDPLGALSHAWFAGYTEANQPDKPDIAVVVMIENVGEGSEYAAPIFRRLVEVYFLGQPSSYLFPWETAPGVTATPTPAP